MKGLKDENAAEAMALVKIVQLANSLCLDSFVLLEPV
jgi:hypothetical protein